MQIDWILRKAPCITLVYLQASTDRWVSQPAQQVASQVPVGSACVGGTLHSAARGSASWQLEWVVPLPVNHKRRGCPAAGSCLAARLRLGLLMRPAKATAPLGGTFQVGHSGTWSSPIQAGAMVTRKGAMWFLANLRMGVWFQIRIQGRHTMFHGSFSDQSTI